MANDHDPVTVSVEKLRADYGRLVERLESNQRDFRRLARSVYRVQEEERRRLARDLHDGIGQNLTALKHQLALVAAEMDPASTALLARLEASIGLCVQTLAETRQLSRLLRPQVLDDLGLEAALGWLARTLGESGGLDISVDAAPLPELDGELQTLLFRVAQEALNNVVRHAGARRASIAIAPRGGWIALTVSDDGRGFEADAPLGAQRAGQSSGLGGMRERLALHGGRLRVEPAAGGGTQLSALVPQAGEGGTLDP